jgi:hypothetical protein
MELEELRRGLRSTRIGVGSNFCLAVIKDAAD